MRPLSGQEIVIGTIVIGGAAFGTQWIADTVGFASPWIGAPLFLVIVVAGFLFFSWLTK